MEVIDELVIDDCYESQYVRDVYFNENITREFIFYLAKMGKLIFEENIARPYFKVIVKGRFTIKGSFGNNGIRILFPDDEIDALLNEIIKRIEEYN